MLTPANPFIAEALQLETDLVLIKPISFSQLLDLVTRLRPPHIIN